MRIRTRIAMLMNIFSDIYLTYIGATVEVELP